MLKYFLFVLSVLALIIAAVNTDISKTAASKVTSVNQRHNHKELFIRQQNTYAGYIKKAQSGMLVTGLLVLATLILLFTVRQPMMAVLKWHSPLLLLAISWVFIMAAYKILEAWSEKMFYVGDVPYPSPSGYLYTDIFSCYAICEPGSYFKTFWVIKTLILLAAIALQFFLYKKEIGKRVWLFVTFVILDILLGNLILVFLHDGIDTRHGIINFI